MKSQFLVSDALSIKNAIFVINGVSEKHMLFRKRGKGSTASGEIEVEIVSIGLVTPRPADKRSQDLQVRVLKGKGSDLKGAVLIFDDEKIDQAP
jgi:hypothetical protein